MKKNNVTQQILEMHENEVMQTLIEEVKEDFKDGIPSQVQSELDVLLGKAKGEESAEKSKVISFKPKKVFKPIINTQWETELLAASGQNLGEWFSQSMSFGGAGFILDIRRVIGSNDEVDLYLTPIDPETDRMKKTLQPYIGKSLQIVISNNDIQLLDAELYVDETGNAAEGSGKLIEPNDTTGVRGKLSIDIVIKD